MKLLLYWLLWPIALVHAIYRRQMQGVRRISFTRLLGSWMRVTAAERYGMNARGETEIVGAFRRQLRNARKRERRAS